MEKVLRVSGSSVTIATYCGGRLQRSSRQRHRNARSREFFWRSRAVGYARGVNGPLARRRTESGSSKVDSGMFEEKGVIAVKPDGALGRGEPELFDAAVEFYRGNRRTEAEVLLVRLLDRSADHVDALHLLGLIAARSGRSARAVELLSRATALHSGSAELHRHLGNALRDQGSTEEALVSYDRAIALRRDFREAFVNRGMLLCSLQRSGEALASFDAALALSPADAETHIWRASALINLGRPGEALVSCDAALRRQPASVPAFVNRASALYALRRHEEALASAEAAIALDPNSLDGHLGRAASLCALDRARDALEELNSVLARDPGNAAAHNLRGVALLDLHQTDEALVSFERAIELRPDFADAHGNRGSALAAMGAYDSANASFDRAVALQPAAGQPRYNKGIRYLQLGWFEEGWNLYEWRHVADRTAREHKLAGLLWDGEQEVAGKIFYAYAEQGLGDTIQFCRYARLLKERGARVILAVQAGLRALLSSLDPEILVVPSSQPPPDDVDFHSSLLSLPRTFRTRVDDIPAPKRYLRADPELVAAWRERLGMHGFRIGICWQGSLGRIDIGRSFSVRHFEGIAALPAVRLVSLQKGVALEQLGSLPQGMTIEYPGDEFDSGPDAFLDAAAVVQCMDLVITCDTSIAHLAGALGRPTWVALKHNPDWRWLLDREDTPWYPSLRLFRQRRPGDWDGVFENMRNSIDQPMLERTAGSMG
jgi:tetratricopeptide (TPR) repeat protein